MDENASRVGVDGGSGGTRCVGCGYALDGLPDDGACPECGIEVERSLKGELMLKASPEYLATLHRGSVLALTALILQLLNVFASAFFGMAFGMMGYGRVDSLLLVIAFVQFGFGGLLLLGWWMLSTPLPSLKDAPQANRARVWVRWLLVASAVLMGARAGLMLVVAMGGGGVAGATAPGWGGVGPDPLSLAMLGLVAVVWIAGYVSQMLYLAWLARRIPDTSIRKRALLLAWLGPVVFLVGAPLLLLGPLVAVVMYWNLLDRFRQAFKRIRRERLRLDKAAKA